MRPVRGPPPAIVADGNTNDLTDMCFWLHAAMTHQAANAKSPLLINHPIAPVAMAILSNQCQCLLHDDLPELSGIPAAQGAQLIAVQLAPLLISNINSMKPMPNIRQMKPRCPIHFWAV